MPEEDEAMTAAILRLLDTPALAERLSRNGARWRCDRRGKPFSPMNGCSRMGGVLMCGICGLVASDPAVRFEPERLLRMRDSMTHRGPDDAGAHFAPGVALGAAAGDSGSFRTRPYADEERGRRFTIVYNGEVWQFSGIAGRTQARGASSIGDGHRSFAGDVYRAGAGDA